LWKCLHVASATLMDSADTMGTVEAFSLAQDRFALARIYFEVHHSLEKLPKEQPANSGVAAALTAATKAHEDANPPQEGKPGAEPPGTLKDVSSYHEHLLAERRDKVKFLPVENPEKLIPCTSLRLLAQKIQSSTTGEQIETLVAELEVHRQALGQLREAVNDAVKEVKRLASKRKREVSEAEKLELSKKRAEQKDLNESAVQQLRKEVQAARNAQTGLFAMNWAQHGWNIPEFGSDAELTKALTCPPAPSQDCPAPCIIAGFGTPFILKDSATVKAAMAEKHVLEWSPKFGAKFHTHPALKNDRANAPCSSEHGSDAWDPVWKLMVPVASRVDANKLPPLEAAMQPWWFGYLSSMCHMDFEAEFLGTLRCHLSGTVKVLLIDALTLLQLLKVKSAGDLPAGISLTQRAMAFLRSLTEGNLKDMQRLC
jgi:hypothetical protein